MILGGYAGKVLFVNLMNGDIEGKPLSEEIAAKTAARGGRGAVMGSKYLKAIAVCGSGKLPIADREKLKKSTEISLNG